MFGRRRRVQEPPSTWFPFSDEDGAYEALYGPHMASGDVIRYGGIQGVVLIAHDMVNSGLFRTIEPWMKWDTMQWDWPENPDMVIEGHARMAEINIALITGADFGFSWAI